MPFKANNNREAVIVWARHVVKRPIKRSVLVKYKYKHKYENSVIKVGNNISDYISTEIASNCEFIFSY